MGVNGEGLKGCLYGGHVINGSGAVLGGPLMTLSRQNRQSEEWWGLWNKPDKMPVIRCVHVVLGVDLTLELVEVRRAVFGRWSSGDLR